MPDGLGTQKKILIITRDFPPFCQRVGWMVRCAALANFLDDQGYKVYVLASARCKQWQLFSLNQNIKTYWVKNLAEYFDSPSGTAPVLRVCQKVIRLILKFVQVLKKGSVVDFTDMALGSYLVKAKALIKAEGIQNVIISVPPHSLHRLAIELKKDGIVNTILDYREGWFTRPSYQAKNKKIRTQNEELEHESLKLADHVVFVSRIMKMDYHSKFNFREGTVIENGFILYSEGEPDHDFTDTVKILRQKQKIIIGYFGSGSIGFPENEKDLSVLFNVIESDSVLHSRFAVIAQGNIIVRSNFKTSTEFYCFPSVTNETAAAHMKLVDIGLNVQMNKEYAPCKTGGKVYEYMGNGIPVLLLGPSSSLSFKELAQRTQKALFANIEDENHLKSVLFQIIREFDNNELRNRQFDPAESAPYLRANQYMQFIPLFKHRFLDGNHKK